MISAIKTSLKRIIPVVPVLLFVACNDESEQIRLSELGMSSTFEDIICVEELDNKSITFNYQIERLDKFLDENGVPNANEEEIRSYLVPRIKELWLERNKRKNLRVSSCSDIVSIARITQGSTVFQEVAYGCYDELVHASIRKRFNTSLRIRTEALIETGPIVWCYDFDVATLDCSPREDGSIADATYFPDGSPGFGHCFTDVACTAEISHFDCDNTNSVCAVYESPELNFDDLVERNRFSVEWDHLAIPTTGSVTITLRRENDSVIRNASVPNFGFARGVMNFPTVPSNTRAYVTVNGAGVTLTSQIFTIEND